MKAPLLQADLAGPQTTFAGLCAWTSNRSAVRPAPTLPPIPACLMPCASSSQLHRQRVKDAMTRAAFRSTSPKAARSEEHTSALPSPCNLVCRLLLEQKENTLQ